MKLNFFALVLSNPNTKPNPMKTLQKNALWLTIVCAAVFCISCEKDEEPAQVADFSSENAIIAAKADNTIEGTLTIMENGLSENDGPDRSPINVSFFTACTTITLNDNGDGTGTILLDFGDGCTLNNGATVTGMILLEYQALVNDSRTTTYSFEDFTYNNNGVTGTGRIIRKLTNANGNPESMVNETITVSFPNSTVTATRVGERIAEWVEGVASGTWTDNVYHINGNWNTTFSNGFERSGEVTKTLVRELSCIYLVEGVLEVTQDGFTGALDFGDGTCDNQAMLTLNGIDYPLNL